MRKVHLAACFQASKGEYINNWLKVSVEFVGFTGVTGEMGLPPKINKPHIYRTPVPTGSGTPAAEDEGKKKGKGQK